MHAALLVSLASIGVGCTSPSDDLRPAAADKVPAKAHYQNIRPGLLQVKSPDVVVIIEKALEANPDFVALRSYFQQRGYSYEPGPASYLTAADSDGKALVGFSYHATLNDGTFGVLVSLYTTPDEHQAIRPVYTYLTEVNYREGTSILAWVDGAVLRSLDRRRE